MARPSKTAQELGYLRSAWEEVEDMAHEHGVLVDVRILMTLSRGTFNIRAEAATIEKDLLGKPLGTTAIMVRFPNGHNTTLAGELWNCLHKLNDMAAEMRDAVLRAQPKG